MKIIFSPFFGNHVFIDLDKKGSLIGQKYAGSQELIGELRLRLGLTSVLPDSMERTAQYMKAIRSTFKENKGSHAEIFRSSFGKDELGVAMTLLGWRDALVGLGWNPSDYTKSQKLNALMDIEKHFDCAGVADCKRELLETLQAGQADLSGITIESVLPEGMLPCYFAALLSAAHKCGAEVVYSPAPSAAAAEGTRLRALQDYLLSGKAIDLSKIDDGSFKVYRMHNADEALRFTALSNPTVISSSETVMLREVFRAMNRPLPKTTDSSVPQVAKLLPLALSLRKKDTDVSSLLAFLSIEPNPLSSVCIKQSTSTKEYFLSVNKALRNHLLSQGGLGEGWQALLNAEKYNWEGETLTDSKKKVLGLVSCVGSSNGTITKEDLTTLLKQLSSWAAKDLESRSSLLQYCRFAELLTEDLVGDIDIESLIRWLASAGAPTTQTAMPAELGSSEVIDTPSSITDTVDTLFWADCWTSGGTQRELDFLSPSDIAELGIETDSARAVYDAQRLMIAYGLSQVKDSLVIMTCDMEAGEPVQEHPLMIELKSCCSVKEECCTDEKFTSLFEVTGKQESQLEHVVSPEHFKGVRIPKDKGGLKRSRESYTSLSTLINYPFDYVTNYLLHWDGYGVESMDDIATVKGTVAHRYIETLLEDSGKDITTAKKLHEEKYSERVEECIREKGAVMYLDEYRLERNSFLAALRPAVDSLLKFIEENALMVIGMEHTIDTVFPVIGAFTGSIDLLLADADGNLVIVDMKWNEGKTYNRRLEKGNTLQLALYRKAMETDGHKVVCEGYFVLPQRKFLTSADYLQPSDIVEIIEGEQFGDHFELACNSYEYRMEQIEQGIIEEAEGFSLADIQYHKDANTRRLYPLERAYEDDTTKSSPYGTPNLILKGGLA